MRCCLRQQSDALSHLASRVRSEEGERERVRVCLFVIFVVHFVYTHPSTKQDHPPIVFML
jgi:hypothetical protein